MANKVTKREDMIGDMTRDEMLELLKSMLKAKEEATKKPTKMQKGGAATKKAIGPQDYRKGGMTISVVDNRKKK